MGQQSEKMGRKRVGQFLPGNPGGGVSRQPFRAQIIQHLSLTPLGVIKKRPGPRWGVAGQGVYMTPFLGFPHFFTSMH